MHGKTIDIFLFDGTGDGIVPAELSNWNSEAIKIPRKDMDMCAKEFEEIKGLAYIFFFVKKKTPTEMLCISAKQKMY